MHLLLIAFLSISFAVAARRVLSSSRCPVAFLMTVSAFGPFSAAASPAPHPLSLVPVAAIAASAAGGSAPDPRKVGAVDFAIVIPAILRLLENDHPAELHVLAETASPISALQRVVLISTLRSGFCMDLRLKPMHGGQAHVVDWQVRLATLSGGAAVNARVEAFDGGWRVCARRAGHFELALQHAFNLQTSLRTPVTNALTRAIGETTAIGWPVALSLTTP